MSGINKIKFLLPEVCRLFRLDVEWLDIDWNVNYRQDLDGELKTETASIYAWIDILEEAIKEGDLVAAMVAIVRVRLYSLSLYGFFINIAEDMERVVLMLPRQDGDVGAGEVPDVCGCFETLLSDDFKFNKIKTLIPSLSALSVSGRDFSLGRWRVDYLSDLDGEFFGERANLQLHLDLMEESIRVGDGNLVVVALMRFQSSAQILSDFFKRIFDDIEKAGWPDHEPLADIPEGYELPERYNYPGR